jgi:hypothetical protein
VTQCFRAAADNEGVSDSLFQPSTQDYPRSGCPACAAEIRRVPRNERDRQGPFAAAMRRYRCADATCGWEGLLPRQAPSRRSAPSRWQRLRAGLATLRPGLPVAVAAVGGMAFAAAVLMGTTAWRGPSSAAAPKAQWLAPGQHHEGVALAAQHPLLQAPDTEAAEVERLALRQGCAWGLPGRNPYRGTVEQALVTAKLPPEVVQRVAMKVRNGQPDDRLEIRNEGIRGSKGEREFDPNNVALTYGHTLCVNARVNFKPGHVERATLYEAADNKGQLHAVMVPDVCGNVSVLGARMERKRPRVAVLAEWAHGGPRLLRLRALEEEDPPQSVPEPATLALAVLALAAAGGAGAWARRRTTGR